MPQHHPLGSVSLVIALMLVFIAAATETARAEQCVAGTPDGLTVPDDSVPTICLTIDPGQPVVTPATVYFKITNGWSSAIGTLIETGDTMSLWSTSLYAAHEDGIRGLRITAEKPRTNPCDPQTIGCVGYNYSAEFAIPVLSAAGDKTMTIQSTKQRVTVSYSFEARMAVMPIVQLYLNAFPKGKTVILAVRTKKLIAEPGPHTVKVILPRHLIAKKCKPYGGCFVLGWARSWISAPGLPPRAEYADRGTDLRKRVYRKAPRAI